MRGTAIKFKFEAKALLFISVLVYFAPLDFTAAYFFAVIFHELGHLICLYFCHKRIYSMRLELKGLVIEHEGDLMPLQAMLCAVSGPALGLLYAYTASFMSNYVFTQFLSLSAGLSYALSVFNSLPVIPLDGADVVKSACTLINVKNPSKILLISGIAVCSGLFALGVYLLNYDMGYGLLAMSIILMLCTLFEEGIVKKGELR